MVEQYVNDFILLKKAGEILCQRDLGTPVSVCRELGVPLAKHKRESPCTRLVFLGIKINMIMGHLRLPERKLEQIKHC